MVYILTDPNYSSSVWCKSFLNSLVENLRKNRIPFCEIFDEIPANAEDVFIIASDYNWIKKTIKLFNKANVSPILICNHLEKINGCEYSCISSDINSSMKSLLLQISNMGKKNIALYGVNVSSIADIGKADALFSHSEGFSGNIKLYNNNGSLSECFESFMLDSGNTDAVICTNDFAAVSLIRNLKRKAPEIIKKITVFSLTNSTLSEYYRKYITSVSIDYNQYGKAALFIYKSRKKHKYLSDITVNVSWAVDETAKSNTSPLQLDIPKSQDMFYNDNELCEMMKLEKLFNISDTTDEIIIKSLLDGLSYEEILNRCFLTENAVKYRIKKLLSECDIADKAELLSLLNKYIGEFNN